MKNWTSESPPSCSRCLARVIYKWHLHSWNTKYSHNVTCIRKNVVLPQLFQKNGYDLTASNVRDILYNTGVVISIVQLIAHSPVGKLV